MSLAEKMKNAIEDDWLTSGLSDDEVAEIVVTAREKAQEDKTDERH